jgi:hypothetical protein
MQVLEIDMMKVLPDTLHSVALGDGSKKPSIRERRALD